MGVDFQKPFSPEVKLTTIRCFLAVAAQRKWALFQLDVNNTFLHVDLHEELYMKVYKGMHNLDNKVCKLLKFLYRLKHASRQWFAKLLVELQLKGSKQSKNDYSLFIQHNRIQITVATVYVDDIILTSDDL